MRALRGRGSARSAELVRVEQAKMLGFMPLGEDSFKDVAARFARHQKTRLTPPAYVREEGIIEKHLAGFFSGRIAALRRIDIQRYVTKRGR